MAKLDEESDDLHQKSTFVQKYKKLRTAYHKQALLHKLIDTAPSHRLFPLAPPPARPKPLARLASVRFRIRSDPLFLLLCWGFVRWFPGMRVKR
jgi:hypothetical protein